jgi:hypothetical protein
MGFLDKFRTAKPPATDEQLARLKTLTNEASDERFEQVLRNYGHDPTQNLPDLLAHLNEKQADALIKAFLFEPATFDQIGDIQILIAGFDHHPDFTQFNEYASEKSLAWALEAAGPKGDYRSPRAFDHLSKKKAAYIITTLKEKNEAWDPNW